MRAAPVPMGAAYSPSTSEMALMFRLPPLRRVSEMVLDTGTPVDPTGGCWYRLGVAEHLLRPGHRRHGVAHSSGVEGIAAVAAKHLLADEDTGQHRHNDHIPVHRGGHEQSDDEAKLSLEKSPARYTRRRSRETRRSHRLPVSSAAPQSSRGRRPYRKQAMQSSGMVIKQTCR